MEIQSRELMLGGTDLRSDLQSRGGNGNPDYLPFHLAETLESGVHFQHSTNQCIDYMIDEKSNRMLEMKICDFTCVVQYFSKYTNTAGQRAL